MNQTKDFFYVSCPLSLFAKYCSLKVSLMQLNTYGKYPFLIS